MILDLRKNLERLRAHLSFGVHGKEIVILDDLFPHPLSTFRYTEYDYYLSRFPKLKIYSNGLALHWVKESKGITDIIQEHNIKNPHHIGRIRELNASKIPKADAYYAIFLNGIFPYIEQIEKNLATFAFTLYPGGGFCLDDEESDRKLRHVLQSRSFRKVITTQRITKEYLLDKNLCTPKQIVFKFGGVVGQSPSKHKIGRKRRFGIEKQTFDVAFVAHRYSQVGAEKGYDLFISSAKAICKQHDFVRFHVVGSYDETILDVTEIKDKISFYGLQEAGFFRDFYQTIDVMLSPNRPFQAAPGMFDGFPTACAVEAVLYGVALVCSDPLKLNMELKPDKDLIIVDTTHEAVVAALTSLIAKPEHVISLAKQGSRTFRRVFGASSQMKPRQKVLRQL